MIQCIELYFICWKWKLLFSTKTQILGAKTCLAILQLNRGQPKQNGILDGVESWKIKRKFTLIHSTSTFKDTINSDHWDFYISPRTVCDFPTHEGATFRAIHHKCNQGRVLDLRNFIDSISFMISPIGVVKSSINNLASFSWRTCRQCEQGITTIPHFKRPCRWTFIFNGRQRSWGKVMFSQVSVSHSVHRVGVGIPGFISFLGWVPLVPCPLWGGFLWTPGPFLWGGYFQGGGYVQGVGMSKGVGTPPTDMRPVGEEWVPIGYHGIQSAYGRHLSYWNAFLLGDCFLGYTCIWRYYFAIIILLKLQICWHLWIPLFKKCNWSPSLPTNTASDFYFCNDSLGTGICMRICDHTYHNQRPRRFSSEQPLRIVNNNPVYQICNNRYSCQ